MVVASVAGFSGFYFILKISRLSRWEVVDVVRTMSTEAVRSGGTACKPPSSSPHHRHPITDN